MSFWQFFEALSFELLSTIKNLLEITLLLIDENAQTLSFL